MVRMERTATSLTDLTTTCVTCGGSGIQYAYDTEDGPAGPSGECPDCDARGWVLDPDRLEAASKSVAIEIYALTDEEFEEDRSDLLDEFGPIAEAAVLAYLEPPT